MQTSYKHASRAKKAALFAALSVSISGCSLLDIGESDYGCSGIPHGIKCHSARTVLDALSGEDPNIQGRSEIPYAARASWEETFSEYPNDKAGDADARNFENSVLAPKSLRVKVRPYTDIRGVRHGPQTLTVVIDKWTIRQQED